MVQRRNRKMQIFVDADACPVVAIIEKIAKDNSVPVMLLCDTNHVLSSTYSKVVVVGAGADAVDDISLLISMSNVYNEFYSRDLAKKIRSSYRTSWANGEFPSGQMAYGYEKDKDNPHQLIPDPVAAPVVKKIFQYFIDGMIYAEIARKLNADEYLCPKAYWRNECSVKKYAECNVQQRFVQKSSFCYENTC